MLDYASSELPDDRRRGSGLLAVALSLILPGLGHMYNGLPRRGAVWLFVTIVLYAAGLFVLALPALVPALLVLVPLVVLVAVWVWIDAWRTAGRSPGILAPSWRIVLSVILVLIAVFAHPVALALIPINRLYRIEYAETFLVTNPAMSPALLEGDLIICHKNRSWDRWSIVVFDAPVPAGAKHLMRIVGLPGEMIHIADGQVHVNGEAMTAPADAGP